MMLKEGRKTVLCIQDEGLTVVAVLQGLLNHLREGQGIQGSLSINSALKKTNHLCRQEHGVKNLTLFFQFASSAWHWQDLSSVLCASPGITS